MEGLHDHAWQLFQSGHSIDQAFYLALVDSFDEDIVKQSAVDRVVADHSLGDLTR